MYMKRIDLKDPVAKLVADYPEILDIMQELGFAQIANPTMLGTVGRFMTLPKGAQMRGIPLDDVKKAFIAKGFTIHE